MDVITVIVIMNSIVRGKGYNDALRLDADDEMMISSHSII